MISRILDQVYLFLYKEKRFYYELINQLDLQLVTDRWFIEMGVPAEIPAASSCKGGKFQLIINTDRFYKYKLSEQASILEHELSHIICGHVFKQCRDMITNIAEDMTINQWIKRIPKECPLPDNIKRPDGEIIKLPWNQTAPWYEGELRKLFPRQKIEIGGLGELQCRAHDLREGGLSQKQVEFLKRLLEGKLKVAVQKAGRNSLPDHLLEYIPLEQKESVQHLLSSFVRKSLESKLSPTRRRLCKKYGWLFPGVRRDYRSRIAIVVDVSGSCDSFIPRFLSLIKNIILTYQDKVRVIAHDAEITFNKELKVVDVTKKLNFNGGGGTKFQPVLDWFIKQRKKFDGIIWLTDGENFDKNEVVDPKIPVLWVLTTNHVEPASFGKKVIIDE